MTDIDLDALEATARAACVPEAWTIWHDLDHQGFKTVGDAESYAELKKNGEADDCDPIAHVYTDDLADHIAAFDPPTVLALIARLREAEANLAAETAAHDDTIRERDRISARLREAEAVIAKVRARTHPDDDMIRPLLDAYETTKTARTGVNDDSVE